MSGTIGGKGCKAIQKNSNGDMEWEDKKKKAKRHQGHRGRRVNIKETKTKARSANTSSKKNWEKKIYKKEKQKIRSFDNKKRNGETLTQRGNLKKVKK